MHARNCMMLPMLLPVFMWRDLSGDGCDHYRDKRDIASAAVVGVVITTVPKDSLESHGWPHAHFVLS